MTNLEIAQAASLKPIQDIAREAGLAESDYEPVGRFKAKLSYPAISKLQQAPKGKLVLVTATTPTPFGEGKTTTSIGITQALRRLGHNAISATREPALGPVFGVKGGAAGGGYSQVLPMEDINLFFTGDFPAIAAAHNLLSAMLDAHLYHSNPLEIDSRVSVWPRTVDMNDRALRDIIVGLGGRKNGFPREEEFVITPASEVMATFCLAESLSDLKERLGRIIVGVTRKRQPVTAADLGCHGAMAALLRDAFRPNLVQTLEGGPALVHGGPFANIAHGCSSLIASQVGLGMSDYVVTEAGFAADLGAEKFMNIVAPRIGVAPCAIVLVTTVRALLHHGGGEDLGALTEGFENLQRHVQHLSNYDVPISVSINRFVSDTQEQLDTLMQLCYDHGIPSYVSDPWGRGGEGCKGVAEWIATEPPGTAPTSLYRSDATLREKVEMIVTKAYGADGVTWSSEAENALDWCYRNGFSRLPVCIAKTQYSLSDDATKLNAPVGFKITIRDLKVSAGAGFVVALTGDILRMPGLGKTPAALSIDIDQDGNIVGLF